MRSLGYFVKTPEGYIELQAHNNDLYWTTETTISRIMNISTVSPSHYRVGLADVRSRADNRLIRNDIVVDIARISTNDIGNVLLIITNANYHIVRTNDADLNILKANITGDMFKLLDLFKSIKTNMFLL